MFRRSLHPPGVKVRRVTQSCALLLALLSLTVWMGCDESALGQQLSGLPVGADAPTDPGATAKEVVGEIGLAPPVGDLDTAPLDPQASGDPGNPPGDPPHPCIQVALEIGEVCAAEAHNGAMACADAITQLFQAGEIDLAHQAARECIEQLNLHTGQCLDGLRLHCEQCVEQLLNDPDAPLGLIQAVIGVCGQSAQHIIFARAEAVGMIKNVVAAGDAHTCAERAHQIATECAGNHEQIAFNCVQLIEALLANGQIDEAFAAAHECIGQIRASSVQCAGAIQHVTLRCLGRLTHGCPNDELIHLVQQASESSSFLVFASAHQAIGQIIDALPG